MLFQELVEQHRVDGFVAHCFGRAFLIASPQFGIHFFYFLGNEAKHLGPIVFNLLLVSKANRSKRQNRFAGLLHRLDLLLEPARRHKRADLVACRDVNGPPTGNRSINISDPGGVAFASNSEDALADADIAAAGRKSTASIEADPYVGCSGCVEIERTSTIRSVVDAGGVVVERISTAGRVEVAGDVVKQGARTAGRVVVAGGVFGERAIAAGRVGVAGVLEVSARSPLAVLKLPVWLEKRA